MSVAEFENPVTTVLRLIESRLRVIKDDGGLARISCSQAHFDRELLKDYDAQITISKTADSCLAQKHSLDGKLRRRIYSLRATIVAVDKSIPGAEAGRVIRDKTLEQILLIIPENRNLPYRTTYNFYPLDATSVSHKAYSAAAVSELAPSNTGWVELANDDYENLWNSNNLSFSTTATGSNEFAMVLFRFKVGAKVGEARNEPREQCLKRLVLLFEGYGLGPGGNGVTFKVWDHVAAGWSEVAVGYAGSDETLIHTLTSNLTDYVDSNGYLYILTRTTNPSNGVTPATLSCDFVQTTIDVRGITFCDIHSYKDIDVTDVKPSIYKEEIILTAWLFEAVAVS